MFTLWFSTSQRQRSNWQTLSLATGPSLSPKKLSLPARWALYGESYPSLQSSSKPGCFWTDCSCLVTVHGRRREVAELGMRWEERERRAGVRRGRKGRP